jgi:uncharacterized membrane protein
VTFLRLRSPFAAALNQYNGDRSITLRRICPMEALDVLSRWIHIGTTVVLVGGAVFTRFVLVPALGELDTDVASQLKARIRRRWRYFVHVGIALLILSGLYNLMAAKIADRVPLYHALIGIKILLAFAVFFLAEAMVGSSAAFEKMRDRPRFWFGMIVLLGSIVIGIAGYLKVRGIDLIKSTETAALTVQRDALEV